MEATDIFAVSIMVVGLMSAIFMLHGLFTKRLGRLIYLLTASLSLYFVVIYFLLLVNNEPLGFTTTWARPALIVLLAVPTMFYLMRDR